jgi:hypothetical protein
MKARCNNAQHPNYHHYGGRGIKVCKRWLKFSNFLADMGMPDKGMTLDRINNDKGYSRSNCRWLTIQEQQLNRSNNSDVPGASWEADRQCWNVRLTHKGKRYFIGRYRTAQEALNARREAQQRIWDAV